MSQNTGEAYAENTLTKLIASHKEMRIALEVIDDSDGTVLTMSATTTTIDRIAESMAVIAAEIAGCVPPSNVDAISQLKWLITLFPGEQYSVLRQALESLIVWASHLS